MNDQKCESDKKNIIEINDLTKKYGSVTALDGLNLKIPQGQLSVLIGPNGSGKSTLLKILSGLAYIDRGKVKLLNNVPSRLSKERFVFQPEVDYLSNNLKISNMIDFYSSQFTTFNAEKALNIADRMNLNLEMKISSLSKGMKARLKLTLSMARKVKLYLLDEPLAGIDPQSRSYILETLNQEFTAGDKSVIMSTHEVMEAEKYFDYVIMLEKGRVKLTGYADDLREENGISLKELMGEVFD
ncbi:MAG: ABC transporter ATP-binding protein [Bacillota bacterium]